MQIPLPPKTILKYLVIGLVVVAGMDAVVQVIRYATGHGTMLGLLRLFDFDQEANVPSWFSSGVLLLCAVLLGVIAATDRDARGRLRWQWKLLALVFVYLSLDEAATIHETFNVIIESSLKRHGIHLPWDAVSLTLLVIIAALYRKFLFELPPRTRNLFILGGALYATGAAGIELAGKFVPALYDTPGLRKAMITAVEETAEIVGLLIFIHALFGHIRMLGGRITITLDPPPGQA